VPATRVDALDMPAPPVDDHRRHDPVGVDEVLASTGAPSHVSHALIVAAYRLSSRPMASLTWVFDSRYGTATIDGTVIEQRRIMVNSGGGARLYSKATTSPVRRLRDATYGNENGQWIIDGTNEQTGQPERWSIPVAPSRARCGSCGS
jgi:hypothetical protein